MTIIWCMIPEIWSVTNRIFLSFWSVFSHFTSLTTRKIKILKTEKKTKTYHFTHVHHKWQSNNVWFLRHCAWQTNLFVILDYFLPFYPPNSSKNENFKKMKKTPGDVIILHMSTKNHDHMLYCSSDMVHDRCNYFSCWDIFCPFTPQTAQKMKI